MSDATLDFPDLVRKYAEEGAVSTGPSTGFEIEVPGRPDKPLEGCDPVNLKQFSILLIKKAVV